MSSVTDTLDQWVRYLPGSVVTLQSAWLVVDDQLAKPQASGWGSARRSKFGGKTEREMDIIARVEDLLCKRLLRYREEDRLSGRDVRVRVTVRRQRTKSEIKRRPYVFRTSGVKCGGAPLAEKRSDAP